MTQPLSRRSAKAQEIVQAALETFDRHGFQTTGLDQIAGRVGIGKSTLYEYFKSKEELFIAVVQEASEQWLNLIRHIATETDDAIERLRRVADTFIDTPQGACVGDKRLLLEIIMQTVMEGGVFYQRNEIIRDIHQRTIRMIADFLLEGVSSGQLNPVIARDAEKFAINFLAFLDGMKIYSMAAAEYIDVGAQIQFFMNHLSPLLQQGKTSLTPKVVHLKS
jgi:AcrR family transcriptional regulator